jgi:hypothetical protein
VITYRHLSGVLTTREELLNDIVVALSGGFDVITWRGTYYLVEHHDIIGIRVLLQHIHEDIGILITMDEIEKLLVLR